MYSDYRGHDISAQRGVTGEWFHQERERERKKRHMGAREQMKMGEEWWVNLLE